jgi:hypothetical protein
MYKAQSADGRMFLMKVGGKGSTSSKQWFIAPHVDFLHDVDPVLLEPSKAVRSRLERVFASTQEGPGEADSGTGDRERDRAAQG